jgi:hypothetical protein
MMMKYIFPLIILITFIPLLQNINAQSTVNPLGNSINKFPSSASKYVNNTPAGQAGLIENNPGYAKYIPNTSSYSNNSKNIVSYYGNNSNSNPANKSHNNISNPIVGELANTTKAVSNIVEKGISSITNLGNKPTK